MVEGLLFGGVTETWNLNLLKESAIMSQGWFRWTRPL